MPDFSNSLGFVVMDSAGELHRFPTAKSHQTVALGAHLQTSIHEQLAGGALGASLAVFNNLRWIKAAHFVPVERAEP